MAKAKTSTEVLKAAKWMIENVGWAQGTGTQYSGNKIVGLCASAAIDYVEVDDLSIAQNARDRLTAAIGDKHGHIVYFNDDGKTTKKDVIRAFNKAIKGSK